MVTIPVACKSLLLPKDTNAAPNTKMEKRSLVEMNDDSCIELYDLFRSFFAQIGRERK